MKFKNFIAENKYYNQHKKLHDYHTKMGHEDAADAHKTAMDISKGRNKKNLDHDSEFAYYHHKAHGLTANHKKNYSYSSDVMHD